MDPSEAATAPWNDFQVSPLSQVASLTLPAPLDAGHSRIPVGFKPAYSVDTKSSPLLPVSSSEPWTLRLWGATDTRSHDPVEEGLGLSLPPRSRIWNPRRRNRSLDALLF
jgi:hypothetical protein